MSPVAGKRDYYAVLDIERGATLDQIKSAYRKAALKNHPDRNPGDPEAEARFKEAAEAYAVLADPEKRSLYDRHGHEGLQSAGVRGFDPSIFADFEGLFGGMFSDLFGFEPRSRSRARRGSDLRFDLEIEFEEAVRGTETQILVPHLERCTGCGGLGAESPDDIESCPSCAGTGQQRFSQGFFTIARTCGTCRGAGKRIRAACRTCQGTGEVRSEKTIEIRIPAGVESGMRLRVASAGDHGTNGGPPGDLYVYISVAEHPIFKRDGQDLVVSVPITFAQAALGGDLRLKGIHGPERIKFPAGTQSGTVVRIRGKGIPDPNGYGKGDLLVQLLVRTPRSLSRQGRKAIEKFVETGDDRLPSEDLSLLDDLLV
jgi:molecular chaperone DnaJ